MNEYEKGFKAGQQSVLERARGMNPALPFNQALDDLLSTPLNDTEI